MKKTGGGWADSQKQETKGLFCPEEGVQTVRKWYLERVDQALLPNRYQSKRDRRRLLVSAECILWVDRQQSVPLLK